MRNIVLKIAFDGTDFHGWQIQKNAYTIEEEITKVLQKLTKEEIKIYGCGRTDTGVHALEYILNFKTNSNIPIEKLPDAINSNMHKDISVYEAREENDEFHSRFSAKSKTYVYRIINSKHSIPFENRFAYKYGGKLDIKEMEKACKEFIGEHDFASHKSKGTETKTTIREMYDCKIVQKDDIIEIEMTANGFLYNMARTIAGTILDCGIGKIKSEDIKGILKSKDRTKAGATLVAKGLFMKKTIYF